MKKIKTIIEKIKSFYIQKSSTISNNMLHLLLSLFIGIVVLVTVLLITDKWQCGVSFGSVVFVALWGIQYLFCAFLTKKQERFQQVSRVIESLSKKNKNIIKELQNILKSKYSLSKEFDENDEIVYIWYLLDHSGLAILTHSGLGNYNEITINPCYRKEVLKYLKNNNIKLTTSSYEENSKNNNEEQKQWLLEQKREKEKQRNEAKTMILSKEIERKIDKNNKDTSVYEMPTALQLLAGMFLMVVFMFLLSTVLLSYIETKTINIKSIIALVLCFAAALGYIKISERLSKDKNALLSSAGLIVAIVSMLFSPIISTVLNEEKSQNTIIVYQNEQSYDDSYQYISKLNVGGTIPNGAKYIKVDGTVIKDGELLPSDFVNGDIFQLPNCSYEYVEDFGIWVKVNKDVK